MEKSRVEVFIKTTVHHASKFTWLFPFNDTDTRNASSFRCSIAFVTSSSLNVNRKAKNSDVSDRNRVTRRKLWRVRWKLARDILLKEKKFQNLLCTRRSLIRLQFELYSFRYMHEYAMSCSNYIVRFLVYSSTIKGRLKYSTHFSIEMKVLLPLSLFYFKKIVKQHKSDVIATKWRHWGEVITIT